MSGSRSAARPALPAPARHSARSRERILREAIGHFGQLGRDAASVPAIARAAGFSHGRVYQLFGTKEALYRAACERDFAELLAEGASGATGRNVADRLLGRLRTLRRALPRHPLARRLLRGGAGEPDDPCQLPAARALRAELRGELSAAARAREVRATLRTEAGVAGLLALAWGLLLLPEPATNADPDPALAGSELLARLLRPPARRSTRGD